MTTVRLKDSDYGHPSPQRWSYSWWNSRVSSVLLDLLEKAMAVWWSASGAQSQSWRVLDGMSLAFYHSRQAAKTETHRLHLHTEPVQPWTTSATRQFSLVWFPSVHWKSFCWLLNFDKNDLSFHKASRLIYYFEKQVDPVLCQQFCSAPLERDKRKLINTSDSSIQFKSVLFNLQWAVSFSGHWQFFWTQ